MGLRQPGALPGALIALATTVVAASILVVFAWSIRRTARSLAPTPAQVHAALARHRGQGEVWPQEATLGLLSFLMAGDRVA